MAQGNAPGRFVATQVVATPNRDADVVAGVRTQHGPGMLVHWIEARRDPWDFDGKAFQRMFRGMPRARDEHGRRLVAIFVAHSTESPTHWEDENGILRAYVDQGTP